MVFISLRAGVRVRKRTKFESLGGGGLESDTTGGGDPPVEPSMSRPGVVYPETQYQPGGPENGDGVPTGLGQGHDKHELQVEVRITPMQSRAAAPARGDCTGDVGRPLSTAGAGQSRPNSTLRPGLLAVKGREGAFLLPLQSALPPQVPVGELTLLPPKGLGGGHAAHGAPHRDLLDCGLRSDKRANLPSRGILR